MIGIPPYFLIVSGKEFVHFTSKIIEPLCFFKISLLIIINILSGKMTSPFSLTSPTRSPSPSKARPRSALVDLTVEINSLRFSIFPGSG